MSLPNDFQRIFQKTRYIYLGFILSLVIYIIVVELISSRIQPIQISQLTTIRLVIYGISVLVVLSLKSLRSELLRKSPKDNVSVRIRKFNITLLITAVICELPAYLGLVIVLIGGAKRDFYFLCGLSFILLFLYFPRYSIWEDWFKDRQNP